MRLVHDRQVPVDLAAAGEDLGSFGQIQRRDNLLLLHPLVDAELVADIAALKDRELLVELLLQLALPLDGKVGGADDQDVLDQAPEFELTDKKPGHDRLAGASIIGEEESYLRQLAVRSCLESVTLRNRSEWRPTSPTTQVSGPLARTVSTRIGSLKSGPLRI